MQQFLYRGFILSVLQFIVFFNAHAVISPYTTCPTEKSYFELRENFQTLRADQKNNENAKEVLSDMRKAIESLEAKVRIYATFPEDSYNRATCHLSLSELQLLSQVLSVHISRYDVTGSFCNFRDSVGVLCSN